MKLDEMMQKETGKQESLEIYNSELSKENIYKS